MRELYVWRLACIDANSDLWEFSKYHGSVIVRASSEQEARLLAGERFGTRPNVVGGVVEVGNPWASPITVLCVRQRAMRCGHMRGRQKCCSLTRRNTENRSERGSR